MGFDLGEYTVDIFLCGFECGERTEDFNLTESVEDEKSGRVPFFMGSTSWKEKEDEQESKEFFSQ